jgi:hypothetical protein
VIAVELSATAAVQLAELGAPGARQMHLALLRLARWPPEEAEEGAAVQVRTTLRNVAACEVRRGDGVLLVYAVLSLREARRRLWGYEIEARLRARAHSRLMHGRW